MPETDQINLKPSQIPGMLRYCMSTQQPVCIWGMPGIGKTQIVHQTVAAMPEYGLMSMYGALLDPIDLYGLPYIKDGRTNLAVPAMWPSEGQGAIFADEINRASMAVQNALLRLVLDRAIGEYAMPDGWHFLAACNREQDGGGILKMSDALANRFLHIHLEPDLTDFIMYAEVNDWHSHIIAFLKSFRQNLFCDYSAAKNSKAWPSPRSWSYVNKILKAELSPDLERAGIAGSVGQAAYIEFAGWLELRRALPEISEILRDPKNAKAPSDTDPSVKYAIVLALAQQTKKLANFAPAIQYISRFKSSGGKQEKEYQVMFLNSSLVSNGQVSSLPEFTKLSTELRPITG